MTVDGDDPSPTIPALLRSASARFGGESALEDGTTNLTYDELLAESRRFGAALIASGIGVGDRVAIWSFNCAEWVIAFFGLTQAGAVIVPINTRFKGAEAADIVARSGARVLVTVTDFLGVDYVSMLRQTGQELDGLTTIVVAHGPVSAGTLGWDEFMDEASEAALQELDKRAAAVRPDDTSDILFTSGTTGRSKGVVMSHERTLRVATDWVVMTGLRPGDRYLMVNPYFHMFGLKAGIMACVAGGATMLPEAIFDVDRVLARIGAEKITVLPGPPTLYQSILDHPDRNQHELGTLRVAVTGSADIPVELIRRIDDELPFSTIITGYGLTEAGTASATSSSDDVETIAQTVGRPRPGFELRIVADDREVEPGQPGEVLLRGGSVMVAYLDDPEATAESLSPEGWLKTGDIGIIDQAGCLMIVGRAKDMFIVGGFNAYPAEIENALLRHPGVRQAAVIGVPDLRMGEVGMAFIVPDTAAVTASEIVAWCREQMANYKVPRRVRLVDELPINATGKVVKDVLRQWASESDEGDR